MLGHREFKASNGWLCKLNERNRISLKTKICEAGLVDQASVQNWISNVLPDMIRDYAIDDIFCDVLILIYVLI
ncbi:tigger transposable element-derived 6-like [Brachionus plicatilis]|uniref:Tigger transposable element-derived 6-like n=1 Tax=Brachionus plicatilis TaxID=10195 RepID=A0A3M7PRP8_BRAPC|nr:tigger transposable element-derived 6-like [Brachionus plicatilis]